MTTNLFKTLILMLSFTIVAPATKCMTCLNLPMQKCYETHQSTPCTGSDNQCFTQIYEFLNKTSDEKSVTILKFCTDSARCAMKTQLCQYVASTIKEPMSLHNCSNITCCTTDDCNTYVVGPTTPPPITIATTTGPAYYASPWSTDMNLCKAKCCEATPSQAVQNRSCCAVRPNGCNGVSLTREVKCEESFCNELHCGASLLQPVMPALFIVSVVALSSLLTVDNHIIYSL